VACENVPTPSGYTLEDAFYIGKKDIKNSVCKALDVERA